MDFFLSLAGIKIRKFTLQHLLSKLASGITVRFDELIVARLVKNYSDLFILLCNKTVRCFCNCVRL